MKIKLLVVLALLTLPAIAQVTTYGNEPDFSTQATPAQITANQNDYAGACKFGNTITLRVSTDAARDITGFGCGYQGRTIIVQNVGAFNVVLKDADVLSLAANRMELGGNVTLAPEGGITIRHDGAKWRPIGGSGSGGGGGFDTITTGSNTTATMTCGTGCTITTSGSGSIVASTAAALAADPADCAANNFATTINAAGTLTCAQPSISAGVSGLGANVATLLGTPSSANFFAAITDEIGNGATPKVVKADSVTGTGTALATSTGALTSGRCVEIDANGNLIQSAAACGTGTALLAPGGNQTFQPTADGTHIFKQYNGTNAVNIFEVQAKDATKYLVVDKDGNVTVGADAVTILKLKQGAAPSGEAGYLGIVANTSGVPGYRDGTAAVVNFADVSSAQSLTNKKLASLSTNGIVAVTGSDGTPESLAAVTSSSATTASNPSAEASLKSSTIVTGWINTVDNVVSYRAGGRYTTAAAQTPTIRLRIKLCTVSGCASGTVVVLADFTTPATTASATDMGWGCRLDLATRTAGASGVVIPSGNCYFNLGTSNTTVTATHIPTITTIASSAIALNATVYIQVTWLNSSSNAGNSATQDYSYAFPTKKG